MTDFSEFKGPSAEWLALDAAILSRSDLSVEELKRVTNDSREESAAQAMINEGLKPKVQIQDYSIIARDGEPVQGRSYRPAGVPLSQPLPVYIHLHGGGHLFGTLASEDATCSRIVASGTEKGVPLVVFNINYRHTPEHRYPTGWNDVEDAFIWVHENIVEIAGLGDQIAVGGISAGAQLAASLTLTQLHGENKRLAACPKIQGQVLMIPWLVQMDSYAPRQEMLRSPELSSLVQCASAPILPTSRIQLFNSLLGVDGLDYAANYRRLNPGNTTAEEVKDLPPTAFGVAGNDPLRDEGLFYAKLLSENGVPTNINVFRGLPHGFRRFGHRLAASKRWDNVMSDAIIWVLSKPSANFFEIKAD